MALFRPKAARDPAARRTADIEALRSRWEEHMARLPPEPSAHHDFVEFRAAAAEFDVRVSRYVGAVISGHADGLEAPFEVLGEYAERLAALTNLQPVRTAELKFFTQESVEMGRMLLEASRLQKSAP